MDDAYAYRVRVERDFVAQHFLTVPDPGPEGEINGHHFRVELRFAGDELDEHGYLVDIDRVEEILDVVEGRYADALLNELPEFAGHNPSVERFTEVVSERVAESFQRPNPDQLSVRIWEDDHAWASHRRDL